MIRSGEPETATSGSGRRILLGVCGGVAAYRAADLIRRLRERGHEVRCAMTPSAASFVSRLTLEVLSGHSVYGEEYLAPGTGGDELHISVAKWADAICVVPATAQMIGCLAQGLAPNFLSTIVLAFRGPLLIAPAMHPAMWEKPAVQANLDLLVARGAVRVGPVEGPLASGEIGLGRLAEVADLVLAIESACAPRELRDVRVLVTAGPTHEPIDPVRYLGNRSTGKMGFALAAEAARRGADVTLVAGPVALATPPGVRRVDVETALEMERAVRELAPGSQLIVMSAAVADFRPTVVSERKIKRHAGTPELSLTPIPTSSLANVAGAVGGPRRIRGRDRVTPEEAERKLRASRSIS
ncbi:MAG: bifunctional phosphopantothenoylcysteine decarboxylase/phosphopantothenate--cysteine ligase CoaBC [Thermoanaerobaculia bacterium]